MGRFELQHKNHEKYSDADCYRKTVPHGMTEAVADVLAASVGAHGEEATLLRAVADDLLAMAGKGPTQNWEVGPLRAEVRAACGLLSDAAFPKFMDGVLNATKRICQASSDAAGEELVQELNEVFAARNFGYTLSGVLASSALRWEARSEADAGIASIDNAMQALGGSSPLLLEHLTQARAHLLNSAEPRSRKDAVRDVMSALEGLVKTLARQCDLKVATKKLRQEGVWGPDLIVKDGLTIWDHLHREYPDVRHGQSTSTEIALEEALYWIDRMTTYAKYMIAKNRTLGR